MVESLLLALLAVLIYQSQNPVDTALALALLFGIYAKLSIAIGLVQFIARLTTSVLLVPDDEEGQNYSSVDLKQLALVFPTYTVLWPVYSAKALYRATLRTLFS